MSTRRLKILVADDDADVRNHVAMTCRELGHDVEVAEDGRACLKKVATAAPDLLFLDLVMPTLDGLSVLKAIREKAMATVVVAISSLDDSEVIASILHAGAAAFLIKPLHAPTIREVIGRVAAGTICGPSEVITEAEPGAQKT